MIFGIESSPPSHKRNTLKIPIPMIMCSACMPGDREIQGEENLRVLRIQMQVRDFANQIVGVEVEGWHVVMNVFVSSTHNP